MQVSDLQGLLLRHKPDIVHFSGHGDRSSQIILEDNHGRSQPVLPLALSTLFSKLKDNIRLVVLNACYSEPEAKAIAQHIECVVGISGRITDQATIPFAFSFYQALGYGKSIKTAFELGCGQIGLEGLDEEDKPKLLTLKADSGDFVFARLEGRDLSSEPPGSEIKSVVESEEYMSSDVKGVYISEPEVLKESGVKTIDSTIRGKTVKDTKITGVGFGHLGEQNKSSEEDESKQGDEPSVNQYQ